MTIKEDVSLRRYNTFGIDVTARYFVTIQKPEELEDIFSSDLLLDYPHLILGGGSNILFTENYNGVVIHLNTIGMELIDTDRLNTAPIPGVDNSNHVFVKVQAGVQWDTFVSHAVARGWGGLENLSLIPGQTGSSPIQNIGAYGVELKDRFFCLEAFEKRTGHIHHFSGDSCQFGYRDSFFKHQGKDKYVITNVTFMLTTSNHTLNTSYTSLHDELAGQGLKEPGIADVRQAVIRIRENKLPDPAVTGNAGSFFKNPVVPNDQFEALKKTWPEMVAYKEQNGMKLAAGWLIEKAGWKGFRKADAGVHHKQALVLVNYGNTTGKEMFELAEEIRESVKNRFNVELTPEVNII